MRTRTRRPTTQVIDQLIFARFEPGGIVEGHPNIKFSTSIIDYVFRVLGVEYLKRYDFAQVPPKEEQTELLSSTDVTAALRAQGAVLTDPPPAIEPASRSCSGLMAKRPAITCRRWTSSSAR